MKNLLIGLCVLFSSQSFSYKPELTPANDIISNCLDKKGVAFCDNNLDNIIKILRNTNVDGRGEFVFLLKEIADRTQTNALISNLLDNLQKLTPFYQEIDGKDQWSYGALTQLIGSVSIIFVKVSPTDSKFLIELYQKQANQAGRYGILSTLQGKVDKINSYNEIVELTKFAEFAKDFSRSKSDEAYVYATAVDIIRKVTKQQTNFFPKTEGQYELTFEDKVAASELRLDSLTMMESTDNDALVVNFIASKSNRVKYSFKSSGKLGDVVFSNEDEYNYDDSDIALPVFKFSMNRADNTISGYFGSARYGRLNFKGKLVKSIDFIYKLNTVKGLKTENFIGKYNLKVNDYDMTLVIQKRKEVNNNIEGALFSPNAIITFSKVSYDPATGILSLLDWNNEKKLALAVMTKSATETKFKGVLINSPVAKFFDVTSK